MRSRDFERKPRARQIGALADGKAAEGGEFRPFGGQLDHAVKLRAVDVDGEAVAGACAALDRRQREGGWPALRSGFRERRRQVARHPFEVRLHVDGDAAARRDVHRAHEGGVAREVSERFFQKGDVRKVGDALRRGAPGEREGERAVLQRSEVGAHIAPPGAGGDALRVRALFGEVHGAEGVGQGRHGMRHRDVVVGKNDAARDLRVPSVQERNAQMKLEPGGSPGLRAVKGVLHIAADGARRHVVKHFLQLVAGGAVHGERYVGRAEFRDHGAGRGDRDAPRAGGVRLHRHASAFKGDAAADFFENRPFARHESAAALSAVARDVVHGGVFQARRDEEPAVVARRVPRELHEVAAQLEVAVRSPTFGESGFEPVDDVVAHDVGHVAPDAVGFCPEDAPLDVGDARGARSFPGARSFGFDVAIGDVNLVEGDGERRFSAVIGRLFCFPAHDAREVVGLKRRVAENAFDDDLALRACERDFAARF